jgi:hypothetical protein
MRRALTVLVVVLAVAFFKLPRIVYNLEEYTLEDPQYREIASPRGKTVKLTHGFVHYELEGNPNGELVSKTVEKHA